MAADLGDGAVSLGNVLVFCEWYDDHARNMQLMEAGFATGQCNNAVLGLAMEQSLDEVLDIITYNAAISAYEKCSKRQQALVSLAKARGVGLPLHVITYNAAVSAGDKGSNGSRHYFT